MSVHLIEIKSIEFGKVLLQFQGNVYETKDCIITPENLYNWDWKLDGTSHSNGVNQNTINHWVSLLNSKGLHVEGVLLSTGMHDKLSINPQTIAYLNSLNIPHGEYNSVQIVKIYNDLIRQNKKIILFLHSTC